jgi:hypothetical protein
MAANDSKPGCLSIIGFFLFLGGAVWLFQTLTATPQDKARWAKNDREHAAYNAQKVKDPQSQLEYYACKKVQKYALDQLRAPSTADFPSCTWDGKGAVTYKGDGHYEVNSYVDSQNGFGAMLRSTFWGKINIAENHWTISDFGFEGGLQ